MHQQFAIVGGSRPLSSTFFHHNFITTFCVAKALAESAAQCSARRFSFCVLAIGITFSGNNDDYLASTGERSMKVIEKLCIEFTFLGTLIDTDLH